MRNKPFLFYKKENVCEKKKQIEKTFAKRKANRKPLGKKKGKVCERKA